MNNAGKKITGWTMAFSRYGVPILVSVSAKNKEAAVAKFTEADFEVIDDKAIHDTVIIRYPGPPEVKKMETWNWEKDRKPACKAGDAKAI
jgi:hypothetical protein